MSEGATDRELVDAAKRALGIERLVLAIHDVSFPSDADEDTGRGSPYTRGAAAFLAFARDLGFDGVQLGPQGQTSPGNASPYDGSVFSKSVLSIALADLAGDRFARALPREALDRVVRDAPPGDARAHYAYAYEAHHRAIALAAEQVRQRAARGDDDARALAQEVARFASDAHWLLHDARFEAFAIEHGNDDWRRWPAPDREPDAARVAEIEQRHAAAIFAYALGQYVLSAQHGALRDRARALGLALYGDLQVGLSLRDTWRRDALFLPRWRMGAPPSRTNPEGQPWGYRVFDPRGFQRRFVGDARTPVLAFFEARARKLFADFDGLRVDHPHGLVCPWVYDGDAADPLAAVTRGARLFESPDLAPLAPFALVGEDQLTRGRPRYDDDWVRGLTDAQVDEYARLFDRLMACARDEGRDERDVLCEVLSTCPAPLCAVMARHGLGRFRVTQKASLTDPADGYRSENAEPRDWIMIGNHDTDPLLRVIDRWARAGAVAARAAYLAAHLEPDESRRDEVAAAIAGDARALVLAMAGELFASPARHVLVFFADLFGEREPYNRPGVVSEENWRMRVPRAFRETYAERRARGEAIDLLGALAVALRARRFDRRHADLVTALEARAAVRPWGAGRT